MKFQPVSRYKYLTNLQHKFCCRFLYTLQYTRVIASEDTNTGSKYTPNVFEDSRSVSEDPPAVSVTIDSPTVEVAEEYPTVAVTEETLTIAVAGATPADSDTQEPPDGTDDEDLCDSAPNLTASNASSTKTVHQTFSRIRYTYNYRKYDRVIKQIVYSYFHCIKPNDKLQLMIHYKNPTVKKCLTKIYHARSPSEGQKTNLVYEYLCKTGACERL